MGILQIEDENRKDKFLFNSKEITCLCSHRSKKAYMKCFLQMIHYAFLIAILYKEQIFTNQ